jgi:hypothetical protein
MLNSNAPAALIPVGNNEQSADVDSQPRDGGENTPVQRDS